MPQGPIATQFYGKTPTGTSTPVLTDAGGNITVITNPSNTNLKSSLDITASTLVKGAPGFVGSVSVLVAGNATGTINDCLTTGAAAIGNQTFTIPATAGVYTLNWPHTVGIVVVPGTGGQTVAVTYQ